MGQARPLTSHGGDRKSEDTKNQDVYKHLDRVESSSFNLRIIILRLSIESSTRSKIKMIIIVLKKLQSDYNQTAVDTKCAGSVP